MDICIYIGPDDLEPGEIETLEPIDDLLDDQEFLDGLVKPPRKYHIR